MDSETGFGLIVGSGARPQTPGKAEQSEFIEEP
jgi:hypothetical protein